MGWGGSLGRLAARLYGNSGASCSSECFELLHLGLDLRDVCGQLLKACLHDTALHRPDAVELFEVSGNVVLASFAHGLELLELSQTRFDTPDAVVELGGDAVSDGRLHALWQVS